MAISPYIRELRAQVGSARLLLPSVSVHLFDERGRLLLVRLREGGEWSTPGGLVEPDESPANAAVREVWEETGLLIRAERILGAYGGPECVVRYGNGDESQYVIIAIGGTVVDGFPTPDLDETVETRFWSEREAGGLPLAPWLRAYLREVYGSRHGPSLPGSTWTPPIRPADGAPGHGS
jgi:8-oxo-dGTP pyrophosphatase MutT (NUDIX family)